MVLAPSPGKLLYTHFEDICEIMKAYDCPSSLGDGLRRALCRCNRRKPSLASWKRLGELTKRLEARNVNA